MGKTFKAAYMYYRHIYYVHYPMIFFTPVFVMLSDSLLEYEEGNQKAALPIAVHPPGHVALHQLLGGASPGGLSHPTLSGDGSHLIC